MKTATISLYALYEKFGEDLENGEIIKTVDNGTDYYDLYTEHGVTCMDGETCIVLEEDEDEYTLLNGEGDLDIIFTLTKDEMDIASFN